MNGRRRVSNIGLVLKAQVPYSQNQMFIAYTAKA